MPLTTVGRNLIASALTGGSFTAFNNANARIGVGDSNTAFNIAQTDLQASTNKLRKGMEAGYPQVSGNTITFRSVFQTNEANFSWQEWGIFNAGPTGGDMLDRVVENLGTKTSAGQWQVTITMTITSA